MAKRPEKKTRWRVYILRKKADPLGWGEAADRNEAEKEAIKQFGIAEKDQKRLSVQRKKEAAGS
jgi:hypothetical protein